MDHNKYKYKYLYFNTINMLGLSCAKLRINCVSWLGWKNVLDIWYCLIHPILKLRLYGPHSNFTWSGQVSSTADLQILIDAKSTNIRLPML